MTPPELRKRTATFSAEIAAFVKPLLRRIDTRESAQQLNDAATSVAANYHVAGRARSRDEFKSTIAVVLQEADESVHWLEHLMRTADVDLRAARKLHAEAIELVKIFAASKRTLYGGPRPAP